MVKYDGLRPGLYLQVGDSIKSLEVALQAWRSNEQDTAAPTDPELLAAAVAWVFIALERRKQRISELAFQWRLNEQDLETLPFKFNTHETIPRLDESIQLYKKAFLLKQRGGGNRLVGLRWLDPTTIEPDYKSWTPDEGITQYIRTVKTVKTPIPAEDLIVFIVPGMRELGPGTPAGKATSFAAQILYGIQQTADTVYDNNALPVMLINVPDGTLESDKETIRQKFENLFNPRRKGTTKHRTTAVTRPTGDKGVEVTPLSIKPDDLAMPELSEQYRDAILAGHFVPISEALSNASSRQTSDSNDASRFTAVLGARADWLASVFNADPDLLELGLTLHFMPEKHWSMRVREQFAAQTFAQLLQGMTPQAAAYVVGFELDQFPEAIKKAGVFRETVTVTPQPNTETRPDIADPTKALLLADLDKWKRKAEKKLRATGKAACAFESEYIDPVANAYILEALEEATTPAAIKAIFDVEI